MARRRILIVDDDDVAARALEARLAGLGYEIEIVELLKDSTGALEDRGLPDPLAPDGGELALDRAAENRFFAIAIDMVCFLDYSGNFKWLNPAWERTLGFTRAELMSKPFIEFVHPDDRERTLRQNREVRGGGQALAFENRYLCKDGSYRWFRWNAAPDIGERVIYSIARDVTDAKAADAERERLVGELQSALAEVNALRGILPICSYCRKIRDDQNYWHTVEDYISRHTTTMFTHGICPSCMDTQIEPEFRPPRGA